MSETPTELQYVERSVLKKEVNTQNFWTFESGTQERINVPICIIVGFQQRDRPDSQKLNNGTFYRPPVTSDQCNIGTKRYPDSRFFLKYNNDDSSQAFVQIKESFKVSTKNDILQPYMSDNDFISSNIDNEIGYNLQKFDIRYQINLKSA